MMSERQGARDPRFEAAVEEGDASGAAPLFDGNFTNDITSWLFANESWNREHLMESTIPKLMYHTMTGHLSWVVFPPQGFRL